MILTFGSLVMALAILQLALAAIGAPAVWRWNWLAGGLLFWGISLFVSVSVR